MRGLWLKTPSITFVFVFFFTFALASASTFSLGPVKKLMLMMMMIMTSYARHFALGSTWGIICWCSRQPYAIARKPLSPPILCFVSSPNNKRVEILIWIPLSDWIVINEFHSPWSLPKICFRLKLKPTRMAHKLCGQNVFASKINFRLFGVEKVQVCFGKKGIVSFLAPNREPLSTSYLLKGAVLCCVVLALGPKINQQ